MPSSTPPTWRCGAQPGRLHHLARQKLGLPAMQGLLAAPELWQDAALLEKLIYKNSNQHTSARYFHRLLEVTPAATAAATLHVITSSRWPRGPPSNPTAGRLPRDPPPWAASLGTQVGLEPTCLCGSRAALHSLVAPPSQLCYTAKQHRISCRASLLLVVGAGQLGGGADF